MTAEHTVYQGDVFGLWGIAHHGGRDEPAFDTEGDAQDYADALNAGCQTAEEIEAFIADRLEPEPELTHEEWLTKHRQDLAAVRVKIETAQADGRELHLSAVALLANNELDPETIEAKREALLKQHGIPEKVAKAEATYDMLREQAHQLEQLLKTRALAIYAVTQEKHLGGVDIKASKVTTLLVDAALAVEYGQKFLPKLIKTTVTWKNKRSFFSALRKRLEGDMDDEIEKIVYLADSPSATVAEDLSEYLVEEAPRGFFEEEDIPF
jgi:hypothetical protein